MPWFTVASAQENPWTSEREKAVVRVQAPKQGAAPSVGAGFIVKGRGGQFFIITATHAVVPDAPEVPASDDCLPLLNGTRLFQTNLGGRELAGNCVRHLGRDISLITLEPGDGNYPTLPLSRREVPDRDWVHLAGYPEGGQLDANRSGMVTSWDPRDQVLITDMATTGGMSGGPYLDDRGYVVGVHRGGLRFQAGFARLTPIWTMESELEKYLPDIPDTSVQVSLDVNAVPRRAIAITTVIQTPDKVAAANEKVVEPLAEAVALLFQSATGDEAPVFDSATADDASASAITYLAGIVFDRSLNQTGRLNKLKKYIDTKAFEDVRKERGFDWLYIIDVDDSGVGYSARTALILFGEGGGTYQNPVIKKTNRIQPIDSLDPESFGRYAALLFNHFAGEDSAIARTKVVYTACFLLTPPEVPSEEDTRTHFFTAPGVLRGLLEAKLKLKDDVVDEGDDTATGDGGNLAEINEFDFSEYRLAAADYATCAASATKPLQVTGLAPEIDGTAIPPEVVVTAELHSAGSQYLVKIIAMQPHNQSKRKEQTLGFLTAESARNYESFQTFLDNMAQQARHKLGGWMHEWNSPSKPPRR